MPLSGLIAYSHYVLIIYIQKSILYPDQLVDVLYRRVFRLRATVLRTQNDIEMVLRCF